VSLRPGFRLTPAQENVYLLTNGDRSYHVKWIPAGDKPGQNEVSINQTCLRDGSAPAPRLMFAAETNGGLVAVWEKLDGTDLRTANRQALPEAFRVLGRFHLAQRCGGPIHSNITEKDYATIGVEVGTPPNSLRIRRESGTCSRSGRKGIDDFRLTSGD